MISEAAITAARHNLVDDLQQQRIIRTAAVERAFRTVPRHAFLSTPFAVAADALASDVEHTDDARRAYADAAIVIDARRNLRSDMPSVVAEQMEQLNVSEGMRALHVGTGTGYYTAILAELLGESGTVVAVEYEPALAAAAAAYLARAGYTTVTVRQGDGAVGVPEAAPFDRILVSAGVADISPDWVAQLADDGRLVVPLSQTVRLGASVSGGMLLAVHKRDGALRGQFSLSALFEPLRGTFAATAEDGSHLAEGLIRWHALEDFLRTELAVRIAMKSDLPRLPEPSSVPWMLETRHAVLWVEPN